MWEGGHCWGAGKDRKDRYAPPLATGELDPLSASVKTAKKGLAMLGSKHPEVAPWGVTRS